ncbi:peptide deformylase 1B, chloroplastic isoform X2 [Prosopis cineraria]|uniref:peptide deformylase 1B, chloroplastic isoform X2 n=1 Tax=Prosopis cineraria TaxID=364024 RepID=UPI0024101C62|nr:peptide deformylase 1B, chloroplastic isoform X2 [Prosopis cineraria]
MDVVGVTRLFSTHFLLPALNRRPARFTILNRLHNSSVHCRAFYSSCHARPSMVPPQAMAKRGFSPKEDEVASSADLQFEAPLEIVKYPDPRLRLRNKRIDSFDDNLKKLVDEMFDVMYKTDGIGLSAPQVGVNVQLMVFNPVGVRGEGEEIALINPRISKYSKKLSLFNEGCLSFPAIYGDRPESVKIDARDVSGKRFSVSFSDLPARVFLHEFDHLQGVLFFERMTEEVLDSIRAQLQALESKYEVESGVPSPEKIENRGGKRVATGFGK